MLLPEIKIKKRQKKKKGNIISPREEERTTNKYYQNMQRGARGRTQRKPRGKRGGFRNRISS